MNMIERIKIKSQSLGIPESWNLEILDSETPGITEYLERCRRTYVLNNVSIRIRCHLFLLIINEDKLFIIFCKLHYFSCTKTCDKMDCKNTTQCFYSILYKIFVLQIDEHVLNIHYNITIIHSTWFTINVCVGRQGILNGYCLVEHIC